MRLSNRNKTGIYNFINTLLLMGFFGGIAVFLLERYRFDVMGFESYLFIILPSLLLAAFYFAGRQIFEYDSDGEALNFKNRNILPFLEKPANDEFPKYKVLGYEVVNMLIFKRLFVKIASKKNNTVTLKYDISFLNRKEVSDLKYSLNKVVNANREKNKEI